MVHVCVCNVHLDKGYALVEQEGVYERGHVEHLSHVHTIAYNT